MASSYLAPCPILSAAAVDLPHPLHHSEGQQKVKWIIMGHLLALCSVVHPTIPVSVTICDTRSGNQSCDWSGDLSPTFSEFAYVCLWLFTYVWSLDLFWKTVYSSHTKGLTSLSFNIDFNTLILSLSV